MLNKLVPDIRKTAELIQEINAASAEQNRAPYRSTKPSNSLDQVIQQNASASEEMASTSEELSSQAEQLQDSIAYFKVDNAGAPNSSAKSKISFSHKVAHLKVEKQQASEPVAANSTRKPKPEGISIELASRNGDGRDKEFTNY